jgi:sortase A
MTKAIAQVVRQFVDSAKRPKSARSIAAFLLLVFGITTLLFTIGAYAWMSIEQRSLSAKWHSQTVSSIGTADPVGITLLSIPKIGLQAAILEGTTTESLLLAPGHLSQTAWPGEPGNAVIAGHRDTFFHRLSELTPGDAIEIRRPGREYRYAVTGTMIVPPDDLRVTRPTKDSRLTLVTCFPTYYIGPAPKRLIVIATLEPAQSQSLAPVATAAP